MKDYENAFLGLILAGVLMMIIGLGLMLAPARSQAGGGTAHVAKYEVDRVQGFAANADDARGAAAEARTEKRLRRLKG